MSKEIFILGYLVFCLIVALLGRRKTIGFWGFFFFSLFLSPIVGLAILIIAKDRGAKFA